MATVAEILRISTRREEAHADVDIDGDWEGLGYKHDCRALSIQYTALPSLIRQKARLQGRRIVREVGLLAATVKLRPAIPASSPRIREK